jgi:lipopolysaccharide export system permease protein
MRIFAPAMFKKIDFYIIKKFLGTYALSLVLVISIAIVIDITEKMDDFYREGLDSYTIIFNYYIHFIPYYINLFSSLFTFLSVIFVTSKLANNSEIIAMLAGGISFKRIMAPYIFSAALIAIFTFYISSEVIPPSTRERLIFESEHITHESFESSSQHKQLQISENEIIYVERFNLKKNIGYRFSYDKFDGKRLIERITANKIEYLNDYSWKASNYTKRSFTGLREEMVKGDTLTMELNMLPKDFIEIIKEYEQLTNAQLRKNIEEKKQRRIGGASAYELELYKRFANPFAAFILTLIGVSIASKKVRGGTGVHIFWGLLLSTTYLLFNITSVSFTVKGGINPLLSVWIPNIIYLTIAIILYKRAPK